MTNVSSWGLYSVGMAPPEVVRLLVGLSCSFKLLLSGASIFLLSDGSQELYRYGLGYITNSIGIYFYFIQKFS